MLFGAHLLLHLVICLWNRPVLCCQWDPFLICAPGFGYMLGLPVEYFAMILVS